MRNFIFSAVTTIALALNSAVYRTEAAAPAAPQYMAVQPVYPSGYYAPTYSYYQPGYVYYGTPYYYSTPYYAAPYYRSYWGGGVGFWIGGGRHFGGGHRHR